MPVALPALELPAFLIFAVALALTVAALRIVRPIFAVLNDALGWVPFAGGWVEHATSRTITALEAVVVAERASMAVLWQGLVWSMRELVAALDFGVGVLNNRYSQLVLNALPTSFANLYADAHALYSAVAGDLASFKQAEAQDIAAVRHYADGAAMAAENAAESYTDAAVTKLHAYVGNAVSTAVGTVEQDIGTAKAAAIAVAEGYTDAVRRAIEGELAAAIAGVETDLGNAVKSLTASLAQTATALEGDITSARAAVEHELTADVSGLDTLIATAEATLTQAIATAEATASADLAQLAGQLGADIASVRNAVAAVATDIASVPSAAAGELADIYDLGADALRAILDRLDLSKLAAFGAGFVLLRALTEAIAREAGLDNSACRSKVKGICGTDPARWGELLAGLVAIGFAFDLRELVQVAESIADPLAAVVREAAGG